MANLISAKFGMKWWKVQNTTSLQSPMDGCVLQMWPVVYHGDVLAAAIFHRFFPSRLFPRGHLYAVWSHLPPTLIAQKEKQGEIWRSKEKYFDIWKSRRRKWWNSHLLSFELWLGLKRFSTTRGVGETEKVYSNSDWSNLVAKKQIQHQWQGTQILSLFGHQSDLMLFWRGWVRKCLKILITHFFHMGFV